MNDLVEILEALRPDLDFKAEKHLIDEGLLDSFDLVSLVSEINDVFGVEIGVVEMQPENFNSLEAMINLIDSLRG